jgi:hypothetical protein
MFSTINSVKEYTGKDLEFIMRQIKIVREVEAGTTLPNYDENYEARSLIKRAQGIIESYIGKDEVDIESASDLLVLDKMTAYQTAYMIHNEDTIWEQVALTSQGQTDYIANFNIKMDSPWIAPLAVIAAKSLSWRRSKSFRTGRIFQRQPKTLWRNS